MGLSNSRSRESKAQKNPMQRDCMAMCPNRPNKWMNLICVIMQTDNTKARWYHTSVRSNLFFSKSSRSICLFYGLHSSLVVKITAPYANQFRFFTPGLREITSDPQNFRKCFFRVFKCLCVRVSILLCCGWFKSVPGTLIYSAFWRCAHVD